MNSSGDTNFLTHLEAFRQVLWRSVAVVAVLLIPGFFAAKPVLTGLIRLTCPPDFKLNYFSPMEPLLVQLKLGLLLSVIVAMPLILHQFARFAAPGLYMNERRIARRAIVVAFLLFLAGAAIGLLLVVPLMMRFSVSYASDSLTPVIGISEFVSLAGLLILSFGIMFQLPIVVVLLMRCGIVEPGTLQRSRPLVVTGIFILAAILTPPDVVSQLLLGIPSWLLFEAALLIGARGVRHEVREAVPSEPLKRIRSETREEIGSESTLDVVYRDSYHAKRRKKRGFRAISGHYRNKRGGRK